MCKVIMCTQCVPAPLPHPMVLRQEGFPAQLNLLATAPCTPLPSTARPSLDMDDTHPLIGSSIRTLESKQSACVVRRTQESQPKRNAVSSTFQSVSSDSSLERHAAQMSTLSILVHPCHIFQSLPCPWVSLGILTRRPRTSATSTLVFSRMTATCTKASARHPRVCWSFTSADPEY